MPLGAGQHHHHAAGDASDDRVGHAEARHQLAGDLVQPSRCPAAARHRQARDRELRPLAPDPGEVPRNRIRRGERCRAQGSSACGAVREDERGDPDSECREPVHHEQQRDHKAEIESRGPRRRSRARTRPGTRWRGARWPGAARAARPPSTVASAPMTATVLSGDEPSLAARTSETSRTSKQAANQVSVNMASIAG